MSTIAEQAEEFLAHFTPSAEQRRQFISSGYSMPDGSYYIRPLPEGRMDLWRAIRAVGRATPNAGESDVARRNAVRRHCITRAKALGLTSMIPDTWNADGSLKQSTADKVSDFLIHYGVLGMKWGVRKAGSPSRAVGTAGHPGRHLGQLKHPVSSDAAKAIELQARVRKSGTRSLSNQELQELVNRLNIESQYGRLNSTQVSAGRKFTNDFLVNTGKQTAQSLVSKYAAKGAEVLIKKAIHK
jgi:hypothetical protein